MSWRSRCDVSSANNVRFSPASVSTNTIKCVDEQHQQVCRRTPASVSTNTIKCVDEQHQQVCRRTRTAYPEHESQTKASIFLAKCWYNALTFPHGNECNQILEFLKLINSVCIRSDYRRVAQLSQREKGGLVMAKSGRRELGDNIYEQSIFNHYDVIGQQSNRMRWKTQNKAYYAVQGHSRSSRSVLIESPYATSY